MRGLKKYFGGNDSAEIETIMKENMWLNPRRFLLSMFVGDNDKIACTDLVLFMIVAVHLLVALERCLWTVDRQRACYSLETPTRRKESGTDFPRFSLPLQPPAAAPTLFWRLHQPSSFGADTVSCNGNLLP